MSDTKFVSGTVIASSWLNDVNKIAYGLPSATASKGADLVGYLPSGPGSVGTLVSTKLRQIVSVKDFGALGDGKTDDTRQVQAAIDYCIANKAQLLFQQSVYRVSSLRIASVEDLVIDLGGATLMSHGSPIDPLISVINCRGIRISNGTLHGNLSLTQTVLLKMWANTGTTGCSYNVFSNIWFRYAQIGFQAGDLSRPDEHAVSETSLVACNFIGIHNCIRVYGIQTEINVIGGALTAGTQGWVQLPGNAVYSAINCVGGNVRVTGGELICYNGSAVIVEPISSASGNLFGKVFCSGTWIEVQSQLAKAINPRGLPSPQIGTVSLLDCKGYLGDNLSAALDCSADFAGEFRVLNCYFWAGVTRTLPNINAANAAHVYVDSMSFSFGYIQGTRGFTGGNLHYFSSNEHIGSSRVADDQSPDHSFDTRVNRSAATNNTVFKNNGNTVGRVTNNGELVMSKDIYAGDGANAGTGKVFGVLCPPMTNGAIQVSGKIFYGNSIPATGSWTMGTIVFNTNPVRGGFIGWVCIASGTPGTWSSFGQIA